WGHGPNSCLDSGPCGDVVYSSCLNVSRGSYLVSSSNSILNDNPLHCLSRHQLSCFSYLLDSLGQNLGGSLSSSSLCSLSIHISSICPTTHLNGFRGIYLLNLRGIRQGTFQVCLLSLKVIPRDCCVTSGD